MENLSPENAVDEIGRLRRRIEALEAERDELAAEVVQSESVARNLVDASPMGVFIYRLDAADQLIFSGANAAAERHLGVGTGQFMGLSIEQAFPPLAETELQASSISKEGSVFTLWLPE